jgi:DNA-binding LytR/AlgR family response regulator
MSRIKYPESTDIVCLEADINYTIFHLLNGKKVISSFTLKKHELALKNYNFLRINRSQLLNQKYIESVEMERKSCLIRLTNGQHFRSSRRKMGLMRTMVL